MTDALSDFNLSNALNEADRALVLNPDSAITRYAVAQALCASGRLDEAAEHARDGCAIDPMMAPINYFYGLVLYYQRFWDEAAEQLERTLEINPGFLTARALRGRLETSRFRARSVWVLAALSDVCGLGRHLIDTASPRSLQPLTV